MSMSLTIYTVAGTKLFPEVYSGIQYRKLTLRLQINDYNPFY
jgi:hypothetical protein